MVYQRVSKPSSGNSQIHRKYSPSTAQTMPVQAKSVSASPQEQEMPSYTPLAANWASNNNLMRSMSGAQVELTHVVQQSEGNVPKPQYKNVPINADPKVENQADVLGEKTAQGESVPLASTGLEIQRQESQSNSVIQRGGVKDLKAAAEEERRKQQAQKFKNPTKKTLEKFFETQSEERKTAPKKLQQDKNTTEMLEQHLTEKFASKSKSSISAEQLIEETQPPDEETIGRFKEQANLVVQQLMAIKAEFQSSRKDEEKEQVRNKLMQLMEEEKPVRKFLKQEIDRILKCFQVLGGFEALSNTEDEKSEIHTLIEPLPELNELYRNLSQKRIETKVLLLGDNRNITSKKEGAKYQNLLKLKERYRIDESKRLRIEGEDERNDQEKTVRYLTPEQREKYKIKAVKQGEKTIYVDNNNNPVDSKDATQTQSSTGGMSGIFIFVMNEDGELHVADEGKESKDNEKFHHSSFLGGKPVAAAGEIQFSSGTVTRISNASGHYQPDLSYMYQALLELRSQGMSLSGVTVTLVVGIYFKMENAQKRRFFFSDGSSETVNLKADTFMDFCATNGVGKQGRSKVTIKELLQALNGTDKFWL